MEKPSLEDLRKRILSPEAGEKAAKHAEKQQQLKKLIEKTLFREKESNIEQEFSGEDIEANEFFDKMKAQLIALELRKDISPEEEDTLNYLGSQIETLEE